MSSERLNIFDYVKKMRSQDNLKTKESDLTPLSIGKRKFRQGFLPFSHYLTVSNQIIFLWFLSKQSPD
jgi:hypothetical protein